VHAARAVLGADTVLSRGDEELALADGALWCDAAAVRRGRGGGAAGAGARALRRRPAPGFHLAECAEFGRWLDDTRQELRERAAGAAWALAARLAHAEQLTEAGRWARRAVRYAWDDERALRRAITLLDRLGDRAGALRLYDEFARRLRAEYEAEPSRETLAMAAALRTGAPLPEPAPRGGVGAS
jgi:serine/threonine-protein kinase